MKKQGFTLVELLATIAILGILTTASVIGVHIWVEKAKEESMKSLNDTLVMAAKTYTENYPDRLPTKIGEKKDISASDIKKAKYLKEDLVNYDKKLCTNLSFVRVYKNDKADYSFTSHVYCEGDEIPEEFLDVPTAMYIGKTENEAQFRLQGNGTNLYSYSYVVMASSDEINFMELYRSEWMKLNKGLDQFEISLDYSEYKNTLENTSFQFIVDVCNENGMCKDRSFNVLEPSVTPVIPETPEIPACVSFDTDSWETIVESVQTGNTGCYQVGDTKSIDMGDLGVHTLRISNMSTPSGCLGEDFSQTGCGFVLEFVDIITTHRMGPTDTNVGGWPVTELRTYLNDTIYHALPETLQNGIIDTYVISGCGYKETVNPSSTDKIYLLALREIHETSLNDPSDNLRQRQVNRLDYYANVSKKLKKYYNGTTKHWWLRDALYSPQYTDSFRMIKSDGSTGTSGHASNAYGVSPAFRLG